MAFPQFTFVDQSDTPVRSNIPYPQERQYEKSSPVTSCLPDIPAIVLCPQCPQRTEWKKRPIFESVMGLLETILENHQPNSTAEKPAKENSFLPYIVDASRIYVTGMSMGGLGSWEFAARYSGGD